MQHDSSKRWGQQEDDLNPNDLLNKKDQQINRLQGILQWEKRRADHANHMLEYNKRVSKQTEESSECLKTEIARRITAEEEEQLREGIKKYVELLKIQLEQKQETLYNEMQHADHQ